MLVIPRPAMNSQIIELQVPPGAGPDSIITFQGADGKECQTQVPEGFSEGQKFHVCVVGAVELTTVDLVVPPGGVPGSWLTFQLAGGCECQAQVPEGCSPGDMFQVKVSFAVENGAQLQNMEFQNQGPNYCSSGLMTLTIQVPHGAEPGSSIGFMSPNGSQMQAQVPEGVVEGQTFQVQVPSSQGLVLQDGFQRQVYEGQISQGQMSEVQGSQWMTVESATSQLTTSKLTTETKTKKKKKKDVCC